MAQQHEENGGDLAADEAEAVHPYELAPVHNADVLDQLRVPAKEHTNEQKKAQRRYLCICQTFLWHPREKHERNMRERKEKKRRSEK